MRRSPYHGNHGNDPKYLAGRIKRDRPDIIERAIAGEFKSMREAAIAAGIIHVPPAEDVPLHRLASAWQSADLETRQIFLALFEEEIDAAYDGIYLREHQARRGPRPYSIGKDATAIPELEALIARGQSLTAIAKALGVTYRTVTRWRAGTAAPGAQARAKLAELAQSA